MEYDLFILVVTRTPFGLNAALAHDELVVESATDADDTQQTRPLDDAVELQTRQRQWLVFFVLLIRVC